MTVHVSTRTLESKSLPGVRFVIRRMTKRRADALDEAQAPFRERLRPLYEEFTPLDKERVEAKDAFPADKLKRWSELLGEIARIDQNEMAPVAARFCLVRIEDLEITYPGADGGDVTESATLELIQEHGPDALYQEILHEIKRECGLLPEEAENLPSPSTSAAAVVGKPENAEPAGTPPTILVSAV
jgi:hypothetical protein